MSGCKGLLVKTYRGLYKKQCTDELGVLRLCHVSWWAEPLGGSLKDALQMQRLIPVSSLLSLFLVQFSFVLLNLILVYCKPCKKWCFKIILWLRFWSKEKLVTSWMIKPACVSVTVSAWIMHLLTGLSVQQLMMMVPMATQWVSFLWGYYVSV